MTAWARIAFDDHSDGEVVDSNAEQLSGCPGVLADGAPGERSLACKIRAYCLRVSVTWEDTVS